MGWAAWVTLAALSGTEGPWVSIHRSDGAVDAEPTSSPSPRWDRVRLRLSLSHRLPVPIRDVHVEVELRHRGAPLAGWAFLHTFGGRDLPPGEAAELSVERALPPRRDIPPAAEIEYAVTIRDYRLGAADVDLAARLIETGGPADQRAALAMDALGAEAVGPAIDAVLDARPEGPTPADALRLLLAVRVAARVGGESRVRALLELFDEREATRWGPALSALTEELTHASEPGEPRLALVPTGAPGLLPLLTRALADIGDRALPALVFMARYGERPTLRQAASGLLSAFGRAHPRAQLATSDRAARLELIAMFGAFGVEEAAAPLAELLDSPDPAVAGASRASLVALGPASVGPLVAALATSERDPRSPIVETLVALDADDALRREAKRRGLELPRGANRRAVVTALAAKLGELAEARWAAEIERGLELVAGGRPADGFRALDHVYAEAPGLYMRHAERIALAYVARGQALLGRGDFDRAIETLSAGASVRELPEIRALLVEGRVALARGYLNLGDLDAAEDALGVTDDPRGRELHAAIALARARGALEAGDPARARRHLDRARHLDPDAPGLDEVARRLAWSDRVGVLFLASMALPVLLLAASLVARRRRQAVEPP